MRLTRGEGWWLMRRREGLGAEEMAVRMGWSLDRLRAIEWDRTTATPFPTRCGTMRLRLTPGEFGAICRRRTGWYAEELARALGVSLTTYRRMERDRVRTAPRLAEWWNSRGIPRARAAAPVVVGDPPKNMRRSIEDRGGRRLARSA